MSQVLTVLFVSQCHEASIAIYSNMEDRRLSHWVCVSVAAMFICFIIYTLTGQTAFSPAQLSL